MNEIILADNQVIFRAGAARVLVLEEDMRLVVQCDDAGQLVNAVEDNRGAIVIFSSSLGVDMVTLLERIRFNGSRAIVIHENGEEIAHEFAEQLDGSYYRSMTGADLVDCVRRVARGERCMQSVNVTAMPAKDSVAARVRQRLTPKELQIVRLIVEGCKNKEIARRLGTKEQVIKNYLRSVYDKTGVSDRLELALFTIHHRILGNEAA